MYVANMNSMQFFVGTMKTMYLELFESFISIIFCSYLRLEVSCGQTAESVYILCCSINTFFDAKP